MSDEEMKESFLVTLSNRFKEVEKTIEENKKSAIIRLNELAKNDQKIPNELEEKMNSLT